jgi:glycosyltransferase involved in cell wall biosynthesis
MRILFLSAWFPVPPSNGSRSRVHHLLRALAPRHTVTLISFADEPGVDPGTPELRELCERTLVIPRSAFRSTPWRAAAGRLSPRPRSLVASHSPEIAALIRREIGEPGCDLVVASQLATATYAPYFAGPPALFEEVELGALHGQLGAQPGWRTRLMWAKQRRYLRRLLCRFDACTVVSERERELLVDAVGTPPPLHVIPNGVAVPAAPLSARRTETVLFTGALRYAPNHEAMRWFLTAVWPRVLAVRPTARLLITGAHDDRSLPPVPNVVRTGFVADLQPLFAEASVAIAPIFAGGGTRVKILEAMGAGTPVVATHKGAEGIAATPGEHLLLADDPATFAAHVLTMLTDAPARERLAAAGRALVESRCAWREIGAQFEALVREVAARRP